MDSPAKFEVRSGLEDLPDRIEIAAISQIATGTCASPSTAVHNHVDLPTSLTPSPLSFSLLTGSEGSLADQIATDQSAWADWTDGLNMLRRDSGHVTSDETAGYIKALTEIGLKIKLLGMCSCIALSIVPRLNELSLQTLLAKKSIYPADWWLVLLPPTPTFSSLIYSKYL